VATVQRLARVLSAQPGGRPESRTAPIALNCRARVAQAAYAAKRINAPGATPAIVLAPVYDHDPEDVLALAGRNSSPGSGSRSSPDTGPGPGCGGPAAAGATCSRPASAAPRTWPTCWSQRDHRPCRPRPGRQPSTRPIWSPAWPRCSPSADGPAGPGRGRRRPGGRLLEAHAGSELHPRLRVRRRRHRTMPRSPDLPGPAPAESPRNLPRRSPPRRSSWPPPGGGSPRDWPSHRHPMSRVAERRVLTRRRSAARTATTPSGTPGATAAGSGHRASIASAPVAPHPLHARRLPPVATPEDGAATTTDHPGRIGDARAAGRVAVFVGRRTRSRG